MVRQYTDDEINELMEIIDSDLVSRDIPIHARPIHSLLEFGNREKIGLPISGPAGVTNPHVEAGANKIAAQISAWIENRYATLLNYNFVLGEFLVMVAGNYLTLKIPISLGAPAPLTWSPVIDESSSALRNESPLNIAALIEGITPALISSATEDEIRDAKRGFQAAIYVLNFLDFQQAEHSLLNEVRNDLKASAAYFQNQNSGYGQSRWSSLQAVEKSFKAVLAHRNIEYKHTHDLRYLATLVSDLSDRNSERIDDVQVGASVRYGEVPSSRSDAFKANVAAFQIVQELMQKIDVTLGHEVQW